nr:hypothetical protein [uncultured Pseudodesulfovibrio sp.]
MSHSREGYQLSKVFKPFSYAAAERTDLLLVDIEARFASLDKNGTERAADKIDLVFLLPKERRLLFVEGKRRKDNRIRCTKDSKGPKVVCQVGRYRQQLEERKDQILTAYGDVADTMGEIFGISFDKPIDIVPEVPILIVGDSDDSSVMNIAVRTNDVWLEPCLDKGNGVWIKQSACPVGESEAAENVYLIDGRDAFLNYQNGMDDLAWLLTEAVKMIDNEEGKVCK